MQDESFFGCDADKRYSVFASVNEAGQKQAAVRVENRWALFGRSLSALPSGSRNFLGKCSCRGDGEYMPIESPDGSCRGSLPNHATHRVHSPLR